MRPAVLDLEYQPSTAVQNGFNWAFGGIALLFGIYVVYAYLQATNRLSTAISQLERVPKVAPQDGEIRKNAQTMAAEIASAKKTIDRLTVPWSDLFSSLEDAQSESIALLAISPDASTFEIKLDGEAKDYTSLLEYTEKLKSLSVISNAYLARHEINKTDPQRPIGFVIYAKWRRHAKV